MLVSRVARKVKDTRLLKLRRRYLNAGIMKDGMVSIRHAGTPQGSPLSPLLSNILLDDFDKELEAEATVSVVTPMMSTSRCGVGARENESWSR